MQACSSAHFPMRPIYKPNLFGDQDELGRQHGSTHRMIPAQQSLEAFDLPSSHIDLRLIVQLERHGVDRLMEIDLEQAPRLGQFVHFRLKQAIPATDLRLCPMQCIGGIRHQTISLKPSRERHCDPNAGADHHVLAVQRDGFSDQRQQLLCQAYRFRRLCSFALHNDELVGSLLAEQISRTQVLPQPLGDDAQHLIANRPSKRVIDHREPVQAERQHRARGRAGRTVQDLLQLLRQHRTVGQAGDRVMALRKGQLALHGATVGDVFVGRHPASARRRLMPDGDHTAILKLDRAGVRFLAFGNTIPPSQIVRRAHGWRAACQVSLIHNATQRGARPDMLGPQHVNLGVAMVANDETLFGVKTAGALHHVL